MQETISKKVNMQEKSKLQTRKENEAKQSNGITLIALVVTIVVLLILAGVSIIVLFGDNGIIKQAEESSLQTKFAEIEERANVIYADLNSKKYAEGNTSKKITMIDIKTELENIDSEKYQIKVENLDGNTIKGITLDRESIKLGKGNTATIKATFDIQNSSNTRYYAKVEEKYYEISIQNNHINIDKTNGKIEEQIGNAGAEQTKEITAVSSNNNVVTITKPITQNENGAIIEITGGETIGEEATIIVSCEGIEPTKCKVMVKMVPTNDASKPNGNEQPIQNSYGKIDIIWLDENNKVLEEPKAPILGTTNDKMTPIKWNETTLVDSGIDETNPEITKADGTKEKDWYDYEKNRWANARTGNESYFVWVPRYAYRITYYASKEDQSKEVGYCDGYGMWRPDGTLEYKLDDGIETVDADDGNKYIVHPAFGLSTKKKNETDVDYDSRKTQNIDNGGWGDTLTGFWFAKFEMSQDKDNLLASVPGVTGIVSKTIGEFYTMGRTATYGQIGEVDIAATDRITKASFMNSHMVKNSEWGAVAYLTHSKYGLNGEEITGNGTESTGGGTEKNSYLNNQEQSTTGNPYGIYDMIGGKVEYIAVFNNTDEENNLEKCKWTENTNLTTSSSSTKYATLCENNSYESGGKLIYKVGKIGEGSKEVYFGGNGYLGWLGDHIEFPYARGPFLIRGGYYAQIEDALNGIFFSQTADGSFNGANGFRTVLCPTYH